MFLSSSFHAFTLRMLLGRYRLQCLSLQQRVSELEARSCSIAPVRTGDLGTSFNMVGCSMPFVACRRRIPTQKL